MKHKERATADTSSNISAGSPGKGDKALRPDLPMKVDWRPRRTSTPERPTIETSANTRATSWNALVQLYTRTREATTPQPASSSSSTGGIGSSSTTGSTRTMQPDATGREAAAPQAASSSNTGGIGSSGATSSTGTSESTSTPGPVSAAQTSAPSNTRSIESGKPAATPGKANEAEASSKAPASKGFVPAASQAREHASTHSRLNREAPNNAYSGVVNEVSLVRPSLRELLANGGAVGGSPLARLAQSLRNSRLQGADRVDAFTPELAERTNAQIDERSSAALRNSGVRGADRVDAFTPDLTERTTAQIVERSSAALVAQATFSQQSAMAVLKLP